MSILKSVSNVTTYEYGFYGINDKHPKVHNCHSDTPLEQIARDLFWKNGESYDSDYNIVSEIHFRVKGTNKVYRYEIKTSLEVSGRFIDDN